MGYLVAVLIGASLSFSAGGTFASEQKQEEGLWVEYQYSEPSVENKHCNLHFSLRNSTKTNFRSIEIRDYIELLDSQKVSLEFGDPIYDKDNETFKKKYFTGLKWHPFVNSQQVFIEIGEKKEIAVFAKDVKCSIIDYIAFKNSSQHSYIIRTIIPKSEFDIKTAKDKLRELSDDKKTTKLLKLTLRFDENYLINVRREKAGISCQKYKGGEIDCYDDIAVNFGKIWKTAIKE